MMKIVQIILLVILLFRTNNCAIIPKIVDGYDCRARDYPYLISLRTVSRSFYCGGSLINRFHVLTAGHCCKYEEAKEQIIVFAGISHKKDYLQRARARKRIIHPELDICVLKLFTPIENTSHTTFVKLATVELFNMLIEENSMEECITLGFGFQGVTHLDGTVEKFTPTKKLQCVHQRVRLKCGAYDHLLCAVGADRPTQDACMGDSGSPLMCEEIQVGFVLSGSGCGLKLPSIYMKISAVYDYIQRVSRGSVLCAGMSTIILILCCLNIFLKTH